ncbi:helix-turn-helix transcriptional regulator [Modestobacter muralis]|uniref:Helix-turn-helix transcriptional regulator n=1 Tax=Modestobacter muralis TaxID=1608614 RepID=A0A6P0ESR0_9ACTN|nr:helix-turn-helix transcriptional regulator [Modestobacter muralis]NEK94147.1 helix-turn-helix transcriptional regulator [Modestobacter muralis]NEN50915.1 helix-turn-helix transcriptional regulator [Modestobacter muralis]
MALRHQEDPGTAPDRMADNFERLIVERCREVRTARRLSQVALATEMARRGFPAWSQATVSNTEAGTRPLRLAELAGLADVLDVPLASLLDGPATGDPAAAQAAAEGALADAAAADQAARDALRAAEVAAADAARRLALARANLTRLRARQQTSTTSTGREG